MFEIVKLREFYHNIKKKLQSNSQWSHNTLCRRPEISQHQRSVQANWDGIETFLFNQKHQKVIILASMAGTSMSPPPTTRLPLGKHSWIHHSVQVCSTHTLGWLAEWHLFYQWPVPRKHKWFSWLFWLSGDVVLLLPTPHSSPWETIF